ncbi:MAG TPA: response regulator transcription factor [Firmicutes bacterium]|nr:response regulator transcription factor [Bacillota bacterium]
MRVLILDDHPVLRKGIAALLAGRDDFEVVGEADNIFDAINKAKELGAETILIDLHLRGSDGARVAQLLRDFLPGVKIALFGDTSCTGYVSGDVVTSNATTNGTTAASDMTLGASYYNDGYASLTRTEEKVMELLARGYRNQAIADALFISVNTVKTHVHSIFRKLKVKSRAEAISLVLNSGAGKGVVEKRSNPTGCLNHTFR